MLLRSARSCSWRIPLQFVQHSGPTNPLSIKTPLHYSSQLRIFSTQGGPLRKPTSSGQQKSSTPAPAQQDKDGAGGNGNVLGGKEVGSKAQRKADLAIMKEMSKYLWPKV